MFHRNRMIVIVCLVAIIVGLLSVRRLPLHNYLEESVKIFRLSTSLSRLIFSKTKNSIMSGCTSCACSSSAAKKTSSCDTEKYSVRQVGAGNSLEYRLFLENSKGQVISPFHDVPLYPNPADHSIVNFFIEIPRWTNAKMEICKEELMNPIKQDVKKGALRFVKNIFPYTGYPWNYGALPQTWEDPHQEDHSTGFKGDNDPIDAIEVGGGVATSGSVKAVKILGCIALLDEGETDWKIFVVDLADPLADKLHDMSDLNEHCPGLIDATRQWFKCYKIPDGKPANDFAFNGQVRDRAFAIKIVEETSQAWNRLISAQTPKNDISCSTRTQKTSPYLLTPDQEALIPKENIKAPLAVDPIHSAWSFVHYDKY
jgi:inorganic pyrophosphatase